MPTTTYMVVDPRHDHSLRVPRPDLSVKLGTPNACNGCHTNRDARWAAAQVKQWYGHDPQGYQRFAGAFAAANAGAIDAAAQLRAIAADASHPAIARASALAQVSTSFGQAALDTLVAGREMVIHCCGSQRFNRSPTRRLPPGYLWRRRFCRIR